MRIVGKGLIAKSFESSDIKSDCVIFASGISDSAVYDIEESEREKKLLISEITKNEKSTIVYFSSIFVNSDSFYYNHKKNMENIILSYCENYLIVRLPQMVGIGGNKNNLFNFLKRKIESDEIFEIYSNSKRSLVDVEDLKSLVEYCQKRQVKGIINLSEIQKLLTTEIVDMISKNLNKKPNYNIKFKSYDDVLENSDIVKDWIDDSNIDRENYMDNLIKKYCYHDKN